MDAWTNPPQARARWSRRALLAAAMAACALPARAAGHASPRALKPGMGSDAADGVFPRRVQHHLGATTVLRAPRRVVVLSTGQIDAALALGVVPAGAARNDVGNLFAPYLARAHAPLQAQMARTLDLGGRAAPDLEAIAALQPDLILVNRAILRPEIHRLYMRIAPTVVTQGNGLNWKVDFLLLADALGRRQQAQAWLDGFHAEAAAHAARLRVRAAPTVSFLQSNGARIRVMGTGSFAGGIAEDMGLARPASQRFPRNSQDLSAEMLDLADADWLFHASRGKGLERSPLWPRLGAVRAHRAVEVDLDAFYLNAGPTAARTVLATLQRAVSS
ncbi:MAG: ABC transporter substrate-binding protein [Pseudorhodoferax sp.]